MKVLNSQKDKAIAQVEKVLSELKEMPDKTPIEEIGGEGLESLIGKQVIIFCAVYIYSGKLVGVNATCVKLENPKVVYETGTFTNKEWKLAEVLGQKHHYIATSMIESFGESSK